MSQQVLNIVFGRLAEEVLQSALRSCGRQETVWTFPDDLSFGPIGALNASRRLTWIQENLYVNPEEWGVFPQSLDNFFRSINSQSWKVVCWACLNSAFEYCGFCSCVREVPGENLYLVDTMVVDAERLEDGDTAGVSFPPRLAHLSPAVVTKLIDREVRLPTWLQAKLERTWLDLCAEDAPLRTIGPRGGKSIPITHFDPLILTFVGADWYPARWVVTQAAVEANQNFFRVDMIVLTGRVRALVKQGRIEIDRDIADPAANIRLA